MAKAELIRGEKKAVRILFCLACCLTLCACSLPSSGPSRLQVMQADTSKALEGIAIIPLTDTLARSISDSKKTPELSQLFGKDGRSHSIVGPGDSLEITVWETPPAILFGTVVTEGKTGAQSTHAETLPAQMIMEDGNIAMPFAGKIHVAGRSLRQIEGDIVSRLQGKANNPQVMVRVTASPSSTIAVIGDVKNSANMPLSPKGERLLDALAAAGGVTQPLTRVSLQLSRGGVTGSMALDRIIREPKENIYLKPGDVLAAMFQPWAFSVLGAAGKNQEIPFEAGGISLAQALARSGGLNDNRADPSGVFIFRFEDAKLFTAGSAVRQAVKKPGVMAAQDQSAGGASVAQRSTGKADTSTAEQAEYTPHVINGKVPVVYQINFSDPTAFFATQNFPVQDKDVIYVADASGAELAKFLRMIGLVVSPFSSGIGMYYNVDRISR